MYGALGLTLLKRLATKIMIAAWYYDNRRRFLASTERREGSRPRRSSNILSTQNGAELYIIINVADSDLTDL